MGTETTVRVREGAAEFEATVVPRPTPRPMAMTRSVARKAARMARRAPAPLPPAQQPLTLQQAQQEIVAADELCRSCMTCACSSRLASVANSSAQQRQVKALPPACATSVCAMRSAAVGTAAAHTRQPKTPAVCCSTGPSKQAQRLSVGFPRVGGGATAVAIERALCRVEGGGGRK